MASISANGSKGHHKFTLNVTEDYIDKDSNVSYVGFSFVLSSLGGGWNWEGWGSNISYVVIVAGERFTGTIPNYDGYSNVTLKSSSLEIIHDDDGSKTIDFSFSVTDTTGQNYTSGNASASGSMALTKIQQYANITSFSVAAIDETSVKYNFTVDASCDYAWYSTDNGANWNPLPNSNIVSGLTAGTSYNFKLRVRQTDSQLTTVSTTYKQSTYNYPYCTNSPDFIIGDALTLTIYNPLSRSITIKGYGEGDVEIFNGTSNGTSISGFNDANSVDIQYSTIPNSQSGRYKVVVSYGNVAMTRDAGNVYRIRGTEIPTINDFSYVDGNNNVSAITENPKHIVQNKSDLKVEFHAATPNKHAGEIVKYVMECNGASRTEGMNGAFSLGAIDSVRDVDLTLTVVDSRGLSASKTIKVTMVPYSVPTAVVTLKRLNNYENTTSLIVNGSVASVNGKNTMMIEYRYKELGGQYHDVFDPIENNVPVEEDLNNEKVFVFNVVVTDSFGSKFDKEYTLDKGVFPLFIDTEKNSVGVNCFPSEEKSFEVNGLNLLNVYKCCKNIYLGSGEGLKITVDEFPAGDKIPIIVVGADNMSMTPVLTIIHLRTDGGRGHTNLGAEVTVTGDGRSVHINGTQWSFYSVYAPLGADITLSNSAL